ncbi:hypothetical protein TIFTF001_023298 [Ficus carica]|uniref:Uncharacterized protein n=1 Tax=Ficus carica TaxID=3494 RepID=A0AA88DG62_FICCA|nr:hypothetical protein TIFTF001_023298 [Ficus carica]
MLDGLFHGLSWIGQAASNHFMAMYHGTCTHNILNIVLTEHKLIIYVHAVGKEKFKYDGNKLPRVVPTRTRTGLVHGLNVIAFK